MNEYLSRIFYDPSDPASFGTVRTLYSRAKEDGYHFKYKDIKNWLEGEETYTLFQPSKKRPETPRVIVSDKHYQYDIDTMNMSKWSKQNDKYAYILVIIDIFTRASWVNPLYTLQGKEVAHALEVQFKKAKPSVVRTDAGSEFVNTHVKHLFHREGIRHWITRNNLTKANFAERLIKTLKTRMVKTLFTNQTHRWIDILQDVNTAYNHAVHRSIGVSPFEALKTSDKVTLWQNQYSLREKKKTKFSQRKPSVPKNIFNFKKNDVVRLVKLKKSFSRAYDEQNTHELFRIVDRKSQNGISQYQIKSWDNELIDGLFYDEELVKVQVNPETKFKVEKIIRKQKRQGQKGYIVRWLGWPVRYDSWVSEKDMHDL